MTPNSPLPNSRPGVVPPKVDHIDQLLSALTDAELAAEELIELEEFAVDNNQTLNQLTEPFHSAKLEVQALLNEPAPTDTKANQLAAALVGMDEPEVVSLAAARATRVDTGDKLLRSQKLNRRLRQLSAVAASFAVVAGIGVVALQGGLGGDDNASTESASGAPTSTTAASASAGEDATFGQEATADDGAMEEAEAAMADAADLRLAEADGSMSYEAAGSSFAVSTPPQELTLNQLSDETGLDRRELLRGAAEENAAPPLCQAAAIEGGLDESQIQRGLVVEQGGSFYELIVLSSEELRVFELPGCVQVD